MKKALWLLLVLLFQAPVFLAQINRDSLLQRTMIVKDDTELVQQLYNYGETFENDNFDSAAFYYKKAKALAEKIGFKPGIAGFSSYYIVLLNNRGEFREALKVAKEALEIYQATNNKKELAIAYLNVGSEWQYLSDFSLAADYYLLSKKMAEENGDRRLQRITNNNLASVFIELQEFEKGKEYAEKSLLIAKELKNDYAISSSMYNIASANVHLKEYDKALKLYQEIEVLGTKMKDEIVLQDSWLGMAETYSAVQNNPAAVKYFDKVLALSKQKNTPEYQMYASMGKADVMLRLNDFPVADTLIKNGISIAQKQDSKLELKDLYLKASLLNEKKGKLTEALDFRKKFELMNDSIVGEKSKLAVANLEAKYEFEKKETTIKQLEAENNVHALTISRKNLLNYILIGGAAVLLAIFLLSYRNYKQQQTLQQQRINELETEKKLLATEAVLKGEEQERTRLAKDLHDGLGGMLSGIKYSFQSMKGNLIMTPENMQAFERSMDMLDSSIKEMRRVAHNLMPEALVKFGLDAALKDFCNDINQSGALALSYQSIGLENAAIDQTSAITVFRIVQELINNVIKHSAAISAIVQVSKTNGNLAITVEDDGKGFDTSVLKAAKGIGWSNIESRIELMKGISDVQSLPGKGTSVHIEMSIA